MENAVYGYISVGTLAKLGEKPSLDLLLIQVAHDRYYPAHIHQVVAGLQRRLQSQGHPVTAVDFPTPGKHPHADLMGGLLLAISSFGFFVLFLSGILALNFIAALMAAQVRQIGIMKALGGTRGQIARVYLLQSLLLGGAATALAIPLGVWGSYLLCRSMAVFLNFDIASSVIPLWVFLLAAAAGVVTPVLACAVPVWRAVAMPVRQALVNSGTPSQNIGTGWLDRMLTHVGGGTRPVLLAIRNSFRRRMRFVLTCVTLMCGGVFFLAALDLRTSMIKTFDRLFGAENYDLTLNLEQLYPVDKINRALHSAPDVLASENWVVVDGWVPREGSDVPAHRFTAIAMRPDSKLFVPVMAQGRRLQTGDTNVIVLNPTMAAQNPQIKVGDEVRLHIGLLNRSWRVAGICREPMLPPRDRLCSHFGARRDAPGNGEPDSNRAQTLPSRLPRTGARGNRSESRTRGHPRSR